MNKKLLFLVVMGKNSLEICRIMCLNRLFFSSILHYIFADLIFSFEISIVPIFSDISEILPIVVRFFD